jgi:putative transposase
MSKKRHTKEAQIKAIRDHESGRSQAEICKDLNITAQTFYRWKKQLGMMTNPDVRRLKELEKENKELKRDARGRAAAGAHPQDRRRKKTLSPRVKRELLPAVMAETPCSQRFACKVLGLRRNTARYRPQRRARDAVLEALLREIYAHHP